MEDFTVTLPNRATNGQAENNFFKTFGLDYKYLENGNDIESLIHLFEEVKDIDHPIVLHIHTEKDVVINQLLKIKKLFTGTCLSI